MTLMHIIITKTVMLAVAGAVFKTSLSKFIFSNIFSQEQINSYMQLCTKEPKYSIMYSHTGQSRIN